MLSHVLHTCTSPLDNAGHHVSIGQGSYRVYCHVDMQVSESNRLLYIYNNINIIMMLQLLLQWVNKRDTSRDKRKSGKSFLGCTCVILLCSKDDAGRKREQKSSLGKFFFLTSFFFSFFFITHIHDVVHRIRILASK